VIRRQRSGSICYMHACVILQHYLQCMRTQQVNHKMLDLSEFIRKHFDNEQLGKSLKDGGGGGSSLDFFARITGIPQSEMNVLQTQRKSRDPELFDEMNDFILVNYTRRGPALVSCFKVEPSFLSSDDTVFDYEVEKGLFDEYAQAIGSKKHGLHSMVLIGAYKDASGKIWFTLQNSWEQGKYIRKVSAEYMASCEAKISFVPMDHNVVLSETFDLVDAEYAETTVDTPEECVDAELFDNC
jgi:hypothetical protein